MAANDKFILNQVRLENLKEGEAREVVKLLRAVQDDLVARLPAATEWSRERYQAMSSAYGGALDSIYSKGILPKLATNGVEFVAKDMAYQADALDTAAVAAGHPSGLIVTANVSPEALVAASFSEPMQGKVMKQWADELNRKEYRLVDAQLRQAWLQGESPAAATARLKPTFKLSQRDLSSITRTYYGELSGTTRKAIWENNTDLIEAQLWDSMLDARTTTTICAPRDQLKYTMGGEPIGHGLAYLGGPGQAHWQCRSTALPVMKGVSSRAPRQAINAGDNYKRGDNVTRTGKVRKNTADARKRGIFNETEASTRTTYKSWLKRQPVAYQEDILGVNKAKAFRSGEWKLGDRFVAPKPTTIAGY